MRGLLRVYVGAAAAGAEAVIIPEIEFDKDTLFKSLRDDFQIHKKNHLIIIIAEGCVGKCGVKSSRKLAEEIEEATGMETRATILGHIQRGGSPVSEDRILASQFGARAVQLLMEGKGGLCIGIEKGEVTEHDIVEAKEKLVHELRTDLYNLIAKLS